MGETCKVMLGLYSGSFHLKKYQSQLSQIDCHMKQKQSLDYEIILFVLWLKIYVNFFEDKMLRGN